VAAGLMLPSLFLAGVQASHRLGWVQWPDQRPQPIGPGVPMRLVVYNHVGVEEEMIARFEEDLGSNRRNGPFSTFLRLLPSQAHGHDGFAFELAPDEAEVVASRLVCRVFENVAPDQISSPWSSSAHPCIIRRLCVSHSLFCSPSSCSPGRASPAL
jgi:hypothetical protein